jgi:major vault protein
LTNATTDAINNAYSTANQESALAIFEATANISRGVSYTKPRTITLDTKYEGVVSVDVWTGYAVNVISKTGKREVVVGPATRLLDYDETLESLSLSTGKPKTTDTLLHTAFLRVENNKISDIINLQTNDYVDVQVKVSYCVDFLEEYKDKWFSVDNYIKYLCDRMRSMLKREGKKYDIQEFYANSTDIIRNLALNINSTPEVSENEKPSKTGRLFKENGMFLKDVEVLSVGVERSIAVMLEAHQKEIIEKTLQIADAETKMQLAETIAETERKEAELENANQLYQAELEYNTKMEALKKREEIYAKERELEDAKIQAEADIQKLYDAIQAAKLARAKADSETKNAIEKEKAEIEKYKQDAYANAVKEIMSSITPGLVEALTAQANADMMSGLGKSIAPYAMAKDESVADAIHKIVRGTTMESVINSISKE